MADVLTVLIVTFGLLFVVGSMLAKGLSLGLRAIVEPLRNYRLVALTMLANFVVVPFAVVIVAALLPLPDDVKAGMIILAFSAGAPFVPKLAKLAGGDVALSVGLVVSLMVATVAIVPLVLPFVLAGATVAFWDVAKPLILLMLLPLAAGLAFRAVSEPVAKLVAGILNQVSSASMFILVFLFLVAYWEEISTVIGTGAVLFSLLLVGVGLSVGYAIGGRRHGWRRMTALATAQRNIEAAIIIASINFVDRPLVEATIIIATLVGGPLLLLISGYWGRDNKAAGEG